MTDSPNTPDMLQHIAIAGLGLMGRGIVTCLLGRGCRVTGLDIDPAAHDRTTEQIPIDLAEMIEHLNVPASVLDNWPQRYTATHDITDLADCDLIIESIIEDHDAKTSFFAELEKIVSPSAIIGSNTSAIPVSSLQAGATHPQRYVGLHWSVLPHAMTFIEVIRGNATSQQTLDASVQFARSLGKRPVVVQKDVVGFVGNRLFYAMLREAFHLVENGIADVEMIDQAMQNAMGAWIGVSGPFRHIDLTGLTAYATVIEQLFPDLCNSTEVPRTLRRALEHGHTGAQSGQGFYEYRAGDAERWQKLKRRFTREAARLIENAAVESESWPDHPHNSTPSP